MEITATIKSDRADRKWGYTEPTYNGRTRYYTNRRGSDRPDGVGIAYVTFGPESLLDNLINRTTRPYAVVKPAVKAALEAAGINTAGMRWSQRAGCSCPCSPGFRLPNYRGHDVWVEVSGVAPTTPDGEEERALRAAALGQDPTLPLDKLANTVLA